MKYLLIPGFLRPNYCVTSCVVTMASYFEGSSEDKPPGKKKKAHSGYEFEGENGFAEFVRTTLE